MCSDMVSGSHLTCFCCSEEQRLASELDYLVFRRILTPLQVRSTCTIRG